MANFHYGVMSIISLCTEEISEWGGGQNHLVTRGKNLTIFYCLLIEIIYLLTFNSARVRRFRVKTKNRLTKWEKTGVFSNAMKISL